MTGPPDARRKDKRCEYHRDHGHNTDSCYSLKDHLEELVQDNRLTQYLPSSTHSPLTPTKRPHDTRRISFDDSDLVGVTHPHTDPLVIELRVNKFTIERVLIDHGNTSEIMYHKTFVKLGFTDSDLSPTNYPLFEFNANPEYPLENIKLPIRADTRSIDVEFLVVKLPSPYNLIMGRTWLHTMQAVPSTYHQLLRFSAKYSIKQIRSSQKSAQACYLLATKRPKELEVHSIEVSNRESLEDIVRIPSEKAIEALHRV
ncbi:uncharacterized protein LOC114261450 [Camellia sinensis]|uniref:uncharacterized protein LOC114261450 n=1 Tax=Camellia sinensis TaxID=4442 RepID=UPI00103581D5|nr:uncharacterized protein LOC114261450 [Camellia sinensis]